MAEAADWLADRLIKGHAKHRDESGAFVAAGRGVLDYPHCLAYLRRAGFAGDLVTHGLEAEEAPGVAALLRGVLA